jgi:two-component system sensor histidine kinase BarA
LIGRAQIVADATDLREHFALSLAAGISAGVAASLLTYAVFYLLRRRHAARLHQIAEAIDQIAAGSNEEILLDPRRAGELAPLFERVNALSRSLCGREANQTSRVAEMEAATLRLTGDLAAARCERADADQAKSDLLAAIGHEIRMPLSGMTAAASLLANADLGARHRRHAQAIANAGQSLLAVVSDMLDLSRMVSGGLPLQRLPLDPAAIADDVVGLFWDSAAAKGLDLALRVAPGLPMSVTGDPLRLNQILSTLVSHAINCTDKGQILLTLRYEEPHLLCSVSDSGRGLTPVELSRVFEALPVADPAGPRAAAGAGLGLSIGKRLAQAMGGDITVQSEPGKGSHFTLRIPAPLLLPARPSPRRNARLPRAGLAFQGTASLSALGTALVASGYEVEVVNAAGSVNHDLIFVEAGQLADLPGNRPQASYVVCLCRADDERGQAACAAGTVQDVLTLPFRQSEIHELLGRLEQAGAAALPDTPPRPAAAARFAGRRVLVADDDAINRDVITTALRQLGIAVEAVADGRAAVEAWRRVRPDLILMDCSMPELDGYAATREIRAREALDIAGGHTPIVALTAIVAGNDAGTWRHAGMDAFMTKPFTLRTITGCLEAQFATLPPPLQAEAMPPGTVQTVLDSATINDLRRIGGSEALFHRVLDLFAGRVPQAVDKLQAMGSAQDLEALADAAHALKSMCANIGALRAVSACDDLELAARTRADFDLGTKLSAIVREVRLTMNEVERLRAA